MERFSSHSSAVGRRTWLRGGLAAVAANVGAGVLPGCATSPVRLGFLGGLTGPTSDLGVAARDSALLAVEMANQRGGVAGAPVELLEFDDRQEPAALVDTVRAMRSAGLVGVVGPMTSSVAAAWIPLANEAGLTTVSPTVTSSDFAGLDDHFFRVCSTTRDYAQLSALHAVQKMGWRRLVLVRDDSNRAYTRSWAQHFGDSLVAQGGRLVHEAVFTSHMQHTGLLPALQHAVGHRPDALVVVANARDTALMAQHLAKNGMVLPMLAGEWAATDNLMAFGGRSVERLWVAQYFDPGSLQPAYRSFVDVFFKRFRREPGFAEVAAHDATVVMLHALAVRRRGETLKQALSRVARFDGLQQTIAIDPSGDAQRRLFMTRVMDGKFAVVA